MAAVAPSRIAALTRLRCEIFQTSYNPTSVRTGAKYLRARLRGKSMIECYAQELTIAGFYRMCGGLKIQDRDEDERLADVEEKKRRGKGAPRRPSPRCVLFASRPTPSPLALARSDSRTAPLDARLDCAPVHALSLALPCAHAPSRLPCPHACNALSARLFQSRPLVHATASALSVPPPVCCLRESALSICSFTSSTSMYALVNVISITICAAPLQCAVHSD